MNIGLFEDAYVENMRPLSCTRPVFELRCGRDRLIDKVNQHVGPVNAFWCRSWVQELARETNPTAEVAAGEDWLLLNGRALVTGDFAPPGPGVIWTHNGAVIAARVPAGRIGEFSTEIGRDSERLREWLGEALEEHPPDAVRLMEFPWNLIQANGAELIRQCRGGPHNGRIDAGAHLLAEAAIHVARGARVMPGVVLNAEDGPILIDREALIQPNAVIEGPCYIGPKSIIRPGASIRSGTTIGPVCKIGGEVECSIFQGFSNKQHDGFLGHSYLGRWINLGANTVTSDLKNTYGTIRVSYGEAGVETGEHLLGSIIGDHAKTGIGTILPTGCIVGVAANIFLQIAVPKFVPDFAWLTQDGLARARIDKVLNIARVVMARRERMLTPAEQTLLERIHALAE